MGWESFVFMIIECIRERNREKVEAGLNNPGIREVLALRRHLRKKEKLRGKELYRAVREGMKELEDMDSEETEALVAEAVEKGGL